MLIRILISTILVMGLSQHATAAVRFVALGDAGEGNAAQYQVGSAMAQVCARQGCDFALYLGDNFYDNGVSSSSDPQFAGKFELPYAQLSFPFYVAQGNHDYGGSGLEFWKPWYELAYAFNNPGSKWKMPGLYYKFTKENAEFFVIDSQSIFLDLAYDEQAAWLQRNTNNSNAYWKIVVAHHPYISNGRHGNAGNYEGCPYSFCDSFNGIKVKRFVEAYVCGRADYYFSGHDHNLQWHEPRCATQFIVSGAGAKTTAFVHRDNNPVFFESDRGEGFMWVEIDGRKMTGIFYDLNGNELYRRVQTK